MLFLTVLFLWHRSYERSCAALAFPALTFFAICGRLLAHRLERTRFAVDYYLDRRSPLRRRLLRGAALPAVVSLAAAAPLTAFLAVFAARSRPTDWLFFCAAAAVAPLLFHGLSAWPGRHLRRDARDVLAARMAGTLLLAALAAVYVYASYHWIPVPGEDIFPGSWERTLEAFSARGRSACPLVRDTLLLAAQIEGLSWYFITTAAAEPWISDGVRLFLWGGFFLNAAMSFTGFVRGLEGAVLLARGTAARRGKEE